MSCICTFVASPRCRLNHSKKRGIKVILICISLHAARRPVSQSHANSCRLSILHNSEVNPLRQTERRCMPKNNSFTPTVCMLFQTLLRNEPLCKGAFYCIWCLVHQLDLVTKQSVLILDNSDVFIFMLAKAVAGKSHLKAALEKASSGSFNKVWTPVRDERFASLRLFYCSLSLV